MVYVHNFVLPVIPVLGESSKSRSARDSTGGGGGGGSDDDWKL